MTMILTSKTTEKSKTLRMIREAQTQPTKTPCRKIESKNVNVFRAKGNLKAYRKLQFI